MKVKRIVSPRAISRFKFMTCAYFVIIAIQYLADFALAKVRSLSELYSFNGVEYSKFEQRMTDYGYIEEYTNNDIFCQR